MAEMTSEITELLAQAMRAIQYGHKPAAAAYLNQILELDPDNMDAWRWLAECMPNQSKRDYCLERAGLASSKFQSNMAGMLRASTVMSQSSYNDPVDEQEPPTLAEKHARKAAMRGQKKAELPPHYHTALPISLEYPKTTNNLRPQNTVRRPQNPPDVSTPRPPRKRRKSVNFKGLVISSLVVAVCTISGYVLFSTGITTGTKVWDWITLQIENNTADLGLFGDNPESTPQSLFNQPAGESSVLATYFPTPIATSQPGEDQNARVAAEIPGSESENEPVDPTDQIPLVDTVIDVSAENQAENNASQTQAIDPAGQAQSIDNSGQSPVVDVSAQSQENAAGAAPAVAATAEPNGFVDGPKVIGKSVKGNNIEVMQFGNGPIERMMVAGIHGGNEWNTTALADQLIEYIKKNPKVIPADRTLYILRLLNPDGEERGHNLDGRTNERGVDLNRNWDAYWAVDWPRDGCWNYRPISAGSSAFSEPETVALRDFLQAHKISALVNYHSAALGIFAGGNPSEAESVRLAKSIAAFTNYAYPPTNTGCKYTGQFADWLAMNGTAAIDLELANHTDTDFEENLKVLSILMKWEPSTGPKSLTGLINLAQNITEKPSTMQQIEKFGVQTLNNLNGLIFGRQEEK